MECTIHWMPGTGMGFVAETGSGHLLTMDGAPDGGGRNLAPRPMETLLAGAGGCTAYDVVLILKRGRHHRHITYNNDAPQLSACLLRRGVRWTSKSPDWE